MEYIKLSYHHLNFEDRTALMLESRKEGFSARKFAELIKRHPSTIYRELKRNSINDVYQAQYASDNTFARRRRGHRKLKIDSILWKFIVEAIRCLWSPQQIAKRKRKIWAGSLAAAEKLNTDAHSTADKNDFIS